MQVRIFHNVTTWGDLAAAGDTEAAQDIARDKTNAKGLAIFRRITFGEDAPIEPGDKFQHVGTLDFPDPVDDPLWLPTDACNAAYAAGNSPHEGDPGVTEYRTWQVRSLSVGDVVAVDDRAFAVAGNGWQEIDAELAPYKIQPSRLRPPTHV